MKHDIQLTRYEVNPVALANGQVVDWGAIYLRAPEFWNEANRGEGAIAFVLDTAGNISHPDLIDNDLGEFYPMNYTNDSQYDQHGHGTHCLGIIGAVDNDQGVIGIAPGIGLVPVKVLGDTGGGSFNWIAQAIRDVADLKLNPQHTGRRKVISMSLGTGPGFATPANVGAAIEYAVGKGVFIIAAAGNSGYTGDKSTVGAPGNHPLVLTVASSAKPGNIRSSFSSGGQEVELIAPGSGIYSTHRGDTYAYLSGTSMACPQVTGIVALILTQYPEITGQQQLIEFLSKHATDVLRPGRDNESGFGSPVIVNYLNQTPDGTPPDDGDGDDGGDDDNGDDTPVDEPDTPNPPRGERKRDVVIPLRGMLFAMQYRRQKDRVVSLATVRDLKVRVTTDVRADALIDIVREYVESYFAGRMLVLKDEHDLYDAAIWTGTFIQFVADDDYVFDRFGERLSLKVESLSLSDNQARELTVDQPAIARRGEYKPTAAEVAVHLVTV